MNIRTLNGCGLAMALGIISASTGWSTMITGSVVINGTAAVSSSVIDFYNTAPACVTPASGGGTNGCVQVGGIPSGSFAGLLGLNATALDLSGGNITGPKNVIAFITFSNGVMFDLVNLPAAGLPGCSTVDTTAGGVSCVPDTSGPSAFRLTNGPGPGAGGTGVANSVGIQFVVGVNGYTGTNASSTPYVGIFTTQVAGSNAAAVLAALAQNGGTGFFAPQSFSASFSPGAVPEPGTILLMGFGLLGVSIASRRFIKH